VKFETMGLSLAQEVQHVAGETVKAGFVNQGLHPGRTGARGV
jgi:hypothetical protein